MAKMNIPRIWFCLFSDLIFFQKLIISFFSLFGETLCVTMLVAKFLPTALKKYFPEAIFFREVTGTNVLISGADLTKIGVLL